MTFAPIKNASDVSLADNPGTLPNLSEAMTSWFQTMTFTRLTKAIVNFSTVETPVSYTFTGVKQPFSPEQLEMKPEGMRSWKWFTIHALPDLILATDDIITLTGIDYRVMTKRDYKEYGYVQYEVVEDYTP